MYHFYFNFIHFVHTGQANFDFNQCSILTECCFWPWKRFEWSKSLLRFPPSCKLKISHFQWRGTPPIPIWKTLFRGMQGHALSHGSSAIHPTYLFFFKFSFWYIDKSWYRLLPPLVASYSPHLLHQVSTPMGGVPPPTTKIFMVNPMI